MSMPMPALLPCPFCGGGWAHTVCDPYHSEPRLEECSEQQGGGWRVCCYGCYVQTWNGLGREEAIATWNRRVTPPSQPQST